MIDWAVFGCCICVSFCWQFSSEDILKMKSSRGVLGILIPFTGCFVVRYVVATFSMGDAKLRWSLDKMIKVHVLGVCEQQFMLRSY